MKKCKVILVFLIGSMVCSVCACGKTEPETFEFYNTEIELVREEASESETVQGKKIWEETEESSEEHEEQRTEISYEMQDWKAAYVEYIESMEYPQTMEYDLIYVDEDDIPELVINTGVFADGCFLVTYHSGEVDAIQAGGLTCRYIEKKNILISSGGHMGEFFEAVYTIENGKWVYITGGISYLKFDEDGQSMDERDYEYEWDGEAVSEEEYFEKQKEVYDNEQTQVLYIGQYDTLEEMLSRLRTSAL